MIMKMQKNIITNLKNIWNKIISSCALQKVFDNVTGIYFDGATIFAVHLIKSENATAEQAESNGKVEKLRNIKSLLDSGVLTQEEFEIEKQKILNS